jgi:hypothetical protein
MNNFKPLGVAAAVAAVTAGYAGAINAQTLNAEEQLGDLAIVPYYTVMDGYATGVNIINTTDQTQVLKFRFRRAVDSMDALDFNVVLSPEDMYTGFISMSGDDIFWTSNDNSCVAPAYGNLGAGDNQFQMPAIYREGAETGYIEIISMGSPTTETAAIAEAAEHDSDGIPADCTRVRDNFFKLDPADVGDERGVENSISTWQNEVDDDGDLTGDVVQNTYVASVDSLKVSYFIKSDETGVEFGNNAVHIQGFLDSAAMTNQQEGVFSGDLQGFDHPDLNGGAPYSNLPVAAGGVGVTADINKFNVLRNILGAESVINDWSQNATGTFSVDTDWVVTFPGQYVMLNLPVYLGSIATEGLDDDDDDKVFCYTEKEMILEGMGTPEELAFSCDNTDIPMTASFDVYDREEQGITVEEGDLVVSPSPPGVTPTDVLDKEVNVIQWGAAPVLNAPAFIEVQKPDGAAFGWASMSTKPSSAKVQKICNYIGGTVGDLVPDSDSDFAAMACTSMGVTGSAPTVGFVAWQRNFADLPAANYGRIVEHSRTQASS